MSSTNAPFGLKAVYHPSGLVRAEQGTITSGYNAGILQGQLVKIVADGSIQAAAAGDRSIGAFNGVEWTDSTGRRRVSNQWIANTTGTEIYAYYYRDPNIYYEIQANGSIAQSDLGSQADIANATAGSTVTGFSETTLDTATLTNSGNAQLAIIGCIFGPDNNWGDAYTIVRVRISEHQDVADRAAY